MNLLIHKMKFVTLLFVAGLLLFAAACKKSGGSGGQSTTCGAVTAVTLSQNGDHLTISVTGGNATNYEIFFQPGANAGAPSGVGGTILASNQSVETFAHLGLQPGNTYTAYVRAICGNSNSDWSSPVNITVNNFCGVPTNLSIDVFPQGKGLVWNSGNGTAQGIFEVQYGPKGFSLGSGTTKTVNSWPFTDMSVTAGTTYDFYVREYCNSATGWSDWSSPLTYYAATSQNACIQPSNVAYTIERNFQGQAVGANITWDANGEYKFEFTYVYANQPVTSGTIQTISGTNNITLLVTQSTNYHFYVRAVCLDGSKTAWTGPFLFNIGT